MLKASVAPFPVAPAQHPGYQTGLTYPLIRAQQASSAAAPGAVDVIYLFPWMPPAAVTPASFGVRVGTGGAGSAMKIGVWRAAVSGGVVRPTGTPIMSNNTGVATTTSSTTTLATVTGVPMVPGVTYWIGAKFTGTLPTVVMVNTGLLEYAYMIGAALGNTQGAAVVGVSAADAYANDIGATDLTSASLTSVLGSAGIPAYMVGT